MNVPVDFQYRVYISFYKDVPCEGPIDEREILGSATSIGFLLESQDYPVIKKRKSCRIVEYIFNRAPTNLT